MEHSLLDCITYNVFQYYHHTLFIVLVYQKFQRKYLYVKVLMIFGQLQQNTPQRLPRQIKPLSENLTYLTCKQLQQAIIKYDDVFIKNHKLTYVMLLGYVISINKVTSPKGFLTRIIKISDGTGMFPVNFYDYIWDGSGAEQMIGKYIKISGLIKNVGTYRLTTQINATSWKLVTDFNEITEHNLQIFHSKMMLGY